MRRISAERAAFAAAWTLGLLSLTIPDRPLRAAGALFAVALPLHLFGWWHNFYPSKWGLTIAFLNRSWLLAWPVTAVAFELFVFHLGFVAGILGLGTTGVMFTFVIMTFIRE
jgi:hypothetical protein